MTFFFDENFSINATRILDIFDRTNDMYHCTSLFEKGTSDIPAELAWDARRLP